MNTIPLESRYANVTGKDHCHCCKGAGLVVVALREPEPCVLVLRDRRGQKLTVRKPTALMRLDRPEDERDLPAFRRDNALLYLEEMGPCPFCEEGYAVEFPTPNQESRHPVKHGPWGADGFWKGQEGLLGLDPLEQKGASKPLPPPETRAKLREQCMRMGVIVRDIPEGDAYADAIAAATQPYGREPVHGRDETSKLSDKTQNELEAEA